MLELVILLVGLSLGASLGWRARELHAQRIVNAMFEQNDKQNEDVMNVQVVKASGQYYIYHADTNAFIVQVKSKDELFEYFKDKYPQKTVMMKKEHFELFDAA